MSEDLTAKGLMEETGKVIPFPASHRAASDNQTTATPAVITYTFTATPFRKGMERTSRYDPETGAFSAVGGRDLLALNIAFDRISHVLRYEFQMAERSNCFDEWKDLLRAASRRIDSFTVSHRKILGTLLSVTLSRDISDFSTDILCIFRDATNTLRLPRIGKQDARRIVVDILKQGEKIMMPLAIDESVQDKGEFLENMLDQLIVKSRSDQ